MKRFLWIAVSAVTLTLSLNLRAESSIGSPDNSEEERKIKEEKAQAQAALITEQGDKIVPIKEDYSPDQPSISLLRHKELYIISGDPNTKGQISFRWKLFGIDRFYIGYTQLMFWDLIRKPSSPFRDINYNPEIFYRLSLKKYFFDYVDLSPFEHISNGRDGLASRSVNRAYVRINNLVNLYGLRTKFQTSLYANYTISNENPKWQDYVAFYDMKVTFENLLDRWVDDSQFSIKFFPGGRWGQRINRGSLMVDFRARILKDPAFPYLYLQYFNGYMESLLEYDQYHRSYRIGILF